MPHSAKSPFSALSGVTMQYVFVIFIMPSLPAHTQGMIAAQTVARLAASLPI
jgi:hypothetical protein